jgi:hypothetical protein
MQLKFPKPLANQIGPALEVSRVHFRVADTHARPIIAHWLEYHMPGFQIAFVAPFLDHQPLSPQTTRPEPTDTTITKVDLEKPSSE